MNTNKEIDHRNYGIQLTDDQKIEKYLKSIPKDNNYMNPDEITRNWYYKTGNNNWE